MIIADHRRTLAAGRFVGIFVDTNTYQQTNVGIGVWEAICQRLGRDKYNKLLWESLPLRAFGLPAENDTEFNPSRAFFDSLRTRILTDDIPNNLTNRRRCLLTRARESGTEGDRVEE